jgi:hypothetical protein
MPIEPVKPILKGLAMGRNRFLHGLDVTPDDRLNWRPGGEAPTPLQLAGKLAGFLTFISEWVQTGEIHDPSKRSPPPPPPATRQEAKDRLGTAFDRMRTVCQAVTEADLARVLPTPWRQPTPLGEILPGIPGIVSYFQGQLNYLQLAYGDTNPNMPPNWGQEEI